MGSRDCPLGLRCVQTQTDLGVCLLSDERECALASDCPESLVCAMEECTNECVEDVDCVAGARCVERRCFEPALERCSYPSECTFPLTCTDGQCVEECRQDADCPDFVAGQLCFPHESCLGGGDCICRFPCAITPECPNPGTECTDGGYCERTASP